MAVNYTKQNFTNDTVIAKTKLIGIDNGLKAAADEADANALAIANTNSNFNDTILKNVGEYVTASMTIKNNKVALCIWAKNTYGQNIIGIYDAFSGTFVPLINPANQTVEITGNGDGTITLSASNANYSTKFAMYLS